MLEYEANDEKMWKHKSSRSDITHERALRSVRKQNEILHEKSTAATRYSEPIAPLSLVASADTQGSFDIEFAKETSEERLSRNQAFYNNRPLMWALNTDGGIMESYVNDLLFNKLFDEVQHNLDEMGSAQPRSLECARSFWDKVRNQLKDKKSEEDDFKYEQSTEEQFVTASKLKQGDRNQKPQYFSNPTTVKIHISNRFVTCSQERRNNQVESDFSLT